MKYRYILLDLKNYFAIILISKVYLLLAAKLHNQIPIAKINKLHNVYNHIRTLKDILTKPFYGIIKFIMY